MEVLGKVILSVENVELRHFNPFGAIEVFYPVVVHHGLPVAAILVTVEELDAADAADGEKSEELEKLDEQLAQLGQRLGKLDAKEKARARMKALGKCAGEAQKYASGQSQSQVCNTNACPIATQSL